MNSIKFLRAGMAVIICVTLSASLRPVSSAEISTSQDTTIPPILIVPDQMELSGDFVTHSNIKGYCTEALFTDMPESAIILGVKPTSCAPENWSGATATAQVTLPAPQPPIVYILEITWPDVAGKGLRSALPNQVASITWDERPLWQISTTERNTNALYYAAEHEAIRTTVVVTRPGAHKLTIHTPPQTAWDIGQIKLKAVPYPNHIKGIAYTPYRDCQMPGGKLIPVKSGVEEDLFRLFHTTGAIRTYAATGIEGEIPIIANSLGLPVYAGASLDNIPKDKEEIQALIAMSKKARLQGAIVGNEYYLRHRDPKALQYLQEQIAQVKKALPAGTPVATAEIDSLVFNWGGNDDFQPQISKAYKPILDTVDILFVHIYPFWNGLPVQGAAEYTIRRFQAIQALIKREYPDQAKSVIIGEAGWPSAGGANGMAIPSPENQRRYLEELSALAEEESIDFFYFDAFDELWKREGDGVGQHWGYSDTGRSAKHPNFGLLLPYSSYLPGISRMDSKAYQTISEKNQSQYTTTASPPPTQSVKTTLEIYNDWPGSSDAYVPSGFMGNINGITLDACNRANPHSGDMAVKVIFKPGSVKWGGVYWQYPEDNWGDQPEGHDLSGAQRLTFWARSEEAGKQLTVLAGGIGYFEGVNCSRSIQPYPDSLCPKIQRVIDLSTTWSKYTLDLQQRPVRDLSHVVGVFGWTVDQPTTFYLDDIYVEFK